MERDRIEFDKAVAELDALVKTLQREGDDRALLMLELVDAIHRPAVELMAAGNFDHPIARALLAMYDLGELDDWTLVEEALDEIRPYIHSHGGEVELLDVSDGVVRVRMSGSCHGCAASAMTLRRGIEAAVRERYPGLREVVAEEADEPAAPAPQLLQIEGVEQVRRPVFIEAGAADDLGSGELKTVDVDGVDVLLCNVEGDVYAFRNSCPVDGMSLAGACITGTVLVCPWHNCAYDARSGKRIDDTSGEGLSPVPIALRDGRVEVAVNVT
jgi:Fe-S cluster biogenesis protein NfuA/nitrite reductase/ring-hydroxylating ferredoxin subunit